MVAAAPSTRLTVMMMNQMKRLTQPSEMRSSVMAKDVLLHTAARMDAKPAALEYSSSLWKSSGLMSALCLPNPSRTQTDCSDVDAASAICSAVAVVSSSPAPLSSSAPRAAHPAGYEDIVIHHTDRWRQSLQKMRSPRNRAERPVRNHIVYMSWGP